jgi:5-methylcytosine-specific restriction endonuclease McrA
VRTKEEKAAYNKVWRLKNLDKVRAWRAANAHKIREYTRRWRALHPERAATQAARDLERNKERARERRARDREAVNAKARAHYAKASAVILAQAREWRRANRDYRRSVSRASCQRRRASCKVSVSKAPTARQLAAILGSPCFYCGGRAQHIDHFVPLSRGGSHDLDNLVAACAACNLSKGAKLWWVEWKGRK